MGRFDAGRIDAPTRRRRSVVATFRNDAAAVLAAAAVMVGALCSCASDDGTSEATVDGAAAVTALVDWAAGELPVVENEDGEVELPVVYVTAQNGDTMDAGLQASVVENTTETANVRFADDRVQAIDETSDIDAVRDGGVMLIVGEMPEPAPTLAVDVEWYESLDESSIFVVQIDAADSGATVTESKPR